MQLWVLSKPLELQNFGTLQQWGDKWSPKLDALMNLRLRAVRRQGYARICDLLQPVEVSITFLYASYYLS